MKMIIKVSDDYKIGFEYVENGLSKGLLEIYIDNGSTLDAIFLDEDQIEVARNFLNSIKGE